MLPDLWSLKILVEVADRGSLTAAADALVMTQPAVSRQIAGLERRLGTPLFRRLPRGVVPTAVGTTAVARARDVLHAVERFESAVQSEAAGETGTLVLTAFTSANTSLVPDAIQTYSRRHQGVAVSLVHVDPDEAVAAVGSGQVDLALVTSWQLFADPHRARHDPRAELLDADALDVELIPLLDEQLSIALPSDHPLAGRRTVRLDELRDEQWIEGAFPDCLGPLHQITEALGAPPRVAFTCDDWNGKRALVASGAGLMVVPTLARGAIGEGITLRTPTPRLRSRRLYVAAARPPYRTAAADAMVAVLVDACRREDGTSPVR